MAVRGKGKKKLRAIIKEIVDSSSDSDEYRETTTIRNVCISPPNGGLGSDEDCNEEDDCDVMTLGDPLHCTEAEVSKVSKANVANIAASDKRKREPSVTVRKSARIMKNSQNHVTSKKTNNRKTLKIKGIGNRKPRSAMKPAKNPTLKKSSAKNPTSGCPKWVQGDIDDINRIDSELWDIFIPPLTLSSHSNAIDFFRLFFDHEFMQNCVKTMVDYSGQMNRPMELGADEFYAFIGILIISGYSTAPRRRLYWSNSKDTKNIMISETMRRNRFDEIFSNVHFCDNNNLEPNDKMVKVRPLIQRMNDTFCRYAPISCCLSIDESMIPYFGRHGCKMFIKSKPIRFGYKAWVLATIAGYCICFSMYQGKNGFEEPNINTDFGKGGSVVLYFAELLRQQFEDLQFSLYFDNFFTSPLLVNKLNEYNFGASGTVRANRLGADCNLGDVKDVKKKERGYYESVVNKTGNIIAVRWNDNSVVTMLSNEFGVSPLKSAVRYSREAKKNVDVPQPNVVHMYNRKMGGVDLLDNHVSNYRIGIRGKKWYIPIAFWIIDVAICNAWTLSRAFGKTWDQLSFRQDCARTLCTMYGLKKKCPGRKRKTISIIPLGPHFIKCGQQRRRCVHCKNKTTKSCRTCNIPLHDKCFEPYHILSNMHNN